MIGLVSIGISHILRPILKDLYPQFKYLLVTIMKLVKALALLLVPLLLTSFLAVAPAAHASKTYKIDWWASYAGDPSFPFSYYQVINNHWVVWAAYWPYDLYNVIPTDPNSHLVGSVWIKMAGVWDLNTQMNYIILFCVFAVTDGSSLGGRTGTFKAYETEAQNTITWLTSGSGVISGGTGDLRGIYGQTKILPDSTDYGHLVATVMLP